MKRFAIITAGGIGKRMRSEIPKQFLLLGNLPILMHSIKRFYRFDNQITIILSLPKAYFNYWNNLCVQYKFEIAHELVSGGETRFHSIKNALDLITEEGVVSVHDGVRPLVSFETVKRTFETAEKTGNAVAYCDIVFSLRTVKNDINIAVNRDFYKEIQTPQVFHVKDLQNSYNVKFKEEFTDDASVFEAGGHKIHLVKGNKENIKITSPEDIVIAEALLNRVR